ncbi:MAG: FxsA family protein [Parvularculaceae bacterium]|nr:FxsA family protein [Parvularculaceae bacterium]
MFLIFLALLIAAPLAELAVLIAAGREFGVLPVVAVCLLTAMLGVALVKRQGLAALRAAERDLATGKAPVEAVVDGAFLALAAPLLMTPGFISDAIGLLLLVPAIRRAAARRALAALRRRLGESATGIVRLRL